MSQEKQILYSVLASVVLHLLLLSSAVLLLGLSGLFPPEPAEASLVNEVVVYLPEILSEITPEERHGQPFIRTNELNRSSQAPASAAFESDRNTVAATENAPPPDADASMPLPSQSGVTDLPFMELDDREYVDGKEPSEDASVPAPPPAPQAMVAMMAPAPPTPLVRESENAERTPRQSGERSPNPAAAELMENSFSDRLDPLEVERPRAEEESMEGEKDPAKNAAEALAKRMREPAPLVPETAPSSPVTTLPPAPPAPEKEAFRPHTRTTEMTGMISNRGRASVDAAETPLGRYKASVGREIEKRWHRYRQDKAEFLVYGSIKLEFKVDRNGTPRNLKIVKNDANAIMVDFTLSAILEADIPPMPEEILDILDNGTLDVTYDVIIY